MKKSLILGGGAATALLAVAAFAQMPPPEGPPKPMTRTELQAKIAEHFNMADTNHDGFVTKAEFTAARDAMKAKMEAKRAEHRDEMFKRLDKDGNGSISRAEFDAAPPPPPRGGPDGAGLGGPGGPGAPGPDGGPGGPHHGHGMRGDHRMGGRGHHGMMMGMMGGDRWFDRADANKDGKLTLAEASAGPLAMFDKADTNHDGTISPEERKAAFEAMRAKWKDHKAD